MGDAMKLAFRQSVGKQIAEHFGRRPVGAAPRRPRRAVHPAAGAQGRAPDTEAT